MNQEQKMDGSPSPIQDPQRMNQHPMMMHMTFYWGSEAIVLFKDWPGTDRKMYIISLVLVFVMAATSEGLAGSRLIKKGMNNCVAGLIQSLLHVIRVSLAYLVMLAVMTFNVGIFLAAVGGHGLGFLLFGSRVFKTKKLDYQQPPDIPPMSC